MQLSSHWRKWMSLAPLAMLLSCQPAVSGEPAGMEAWQRNHPEASRDLGIWVKDHPEAAHLFFEWDGKHTEKAHEFVTWTIRHPKATIEKFTGSHAKWEFFDEIQEKHRPAAEAFMAWCRQHAAAAEELMRHPRGLEWAGYHLYQSSWHMEHPYRP